MALHPSIFKTEIVSESNGKMVIKLQAGPNELFFKPGMTGSIDMNGKNRRFSVSEIKKESEWTCLECTLKETHPENLQKIQA
jgi:hypothetical protein